MLQITVFDHRGCAEHENKEYTGPKSGDENDEMLVEVKQTKFNRDNPKFTDMADSIYRVCELLVTNILKSIQLPGFLVSLSCTMGWMPTKQNAIYFAKALSHVLLALFRHLSHSRSIAKISPSLYLPLPLALSLSLLILNQRRLVLLTHVSAPPARRSRSARCTSTPSATSATRASKRPRTAVPADAGRWGAAP
jgi:hypothetical protein